MPGGKASDVWAQSSRSSQALVCFFPLLDGCFALVFWIPGFLRGSKKGSCLICTKLAAGEVKLVFDHDVGEIVRRWMVDTKCVRCEMGHFYVRKIS